MSKRGGWAVFPVALGRFAVGKYVNGGGKRWKETDVFDDEAQAQTVFAAKILEKSENSLDSVKPLPGKERH